MSAVAEAQTIDQPTEQRIAGRYVLGRQVGAGSSGTVFLTEDLETGRTCAIKIREAKDQEQPVRFIAEAQDMRRLRHPRLVPVLDSGNDGPLYWYVMPYYRRGCLRDRVKELGPIEPFGALDWTFQVLEGLSAVHQAGLVHRDVKPHNVMLGDDDRALLADFGLARHVHGGVPYRTRTDQSMGTPNYRAPEQALDAANADLRADIYGVGATLYYLLTARRPGFLGMVDEDDPLLDRVPDDLRPFVLKCMACSPERRFQDARSCALEVARLADQHGGPDGPIADEWMARFDGMGKQRWLDRLFGWMRR
jgi:serine/threonine-protein kinase